MCESHRGLAELSRRTLFTKAAGVAIGAWAGFSGAKFGSVAEAQSVGPIIRSVIAPLVGPFSMPGVPGGSDVRSYLAISGREVTLIDCLTADNVSFVRDVLALNGLGVADIANIVVTHLHPDHQGGLPAIAAEAPNATIYAGERDISGIRSPRPIVALGEGATLSGMRVYDTPGHTGGHIVLYDPASRTMIMGDSASNRGGRLSVLAAAPQLDNALDSLLKLANTGMRTAYFGHGLTIEENASQIVGQWATEQRVVRLVDRLLGR